VQIITYDPFFPLDAKVIALKRAGPKAVYPFSSNFSILLIRDSKD
jgi:hypothetical protein